LRKDKGQNRMTLTILIITRRAYCPRCWVRTDQDKTARGWVCQGCNALLTAWCELAGE